MEYDDSTVVLKKPDKLVNYFFILENHIFVGTENGSVKAKNAKTIPM